VKRITTGSRFRKDVKLAQRRGKDMTKLRDLIEMLAAGKPLPERCRDHSLKGEFASFRDCHIEPDWLLIYATTKEDLKLVRTGTHGDLFR
jgi:mRNA interferase YafQ